MSKLARTPPNKQQSPSRSESDLLKLDDDSESEMNDRTPPNFVTSRSKRIREEDLPEEFCKFREEMVSQFNMFKTTQESELKAIISSLKNIQQTSINIESSILNLSSQNEEYRKKIDKLELQGKKDREYIAVLEDKLEDQQRISRKTCIELKNVPRMPKESGDDLINMVESLSKHVSLEMDRRDIKDIYRLPSKKEGVTNSPIIVELASTILKTNLLKKAKSYNIKNNTKLQAKHLGLKNNTEVPVFISEQLTPKGARLFFLARDLVKSKKYKFCWTTYGRVLVKRDENSGAIVINSEAQVHQLVQGA